MSTKTDRPPIDESRLAKTTHVFEQCKTVVAGGESSYARLSNTRPIVMSHGKGARFWDVDGNEYLDWCIGYGPMVFGHCPERINKAVIEQIAERGSLYTFPHELDYEVGRKIVQSVPSVDLVRFCNSGTEATMAAMRLARAYTGKDKVLKFEGMYHGWSDANALAYHPPLDNSGPECAPWPVRFHSGIPRVQEECLVIGTYNDFEGVEKLVRENAGELAAIITEPCMANSGVIPPLEGWNQHLRSLCDRYGLLLIFDEVITGFRMALGGCQELYGVNADITTWGKAIGGGFPCAAAFGGTKEVMDVETRAEVFHGGTYSANPVVMSAMNAALDIFINEGDQVYSHLQRIADALVGGLREIFADNDVPVQINQVKGMWQVFFSDEPVTRFRLARANDGVFYHHFQREMQARGVYFHNYQMERWFSSTAHTMEDVEITLEVAKEAVAKVKDKLGNSRQLLAALA
jgi:glutamate-1-semialdehyde 2,1-aminomutase